MNVQNIHIVTFFNMSIKIPHRQEQLKGEEESKLACMYIFKYFEILHITCMDHVHIHALLRTLIPVCTVVRVEGLNSLGSIFLT